jgi:hypothetical protein
MQNNTRTLSLIINRVSFKKLEYIIFKGGEGTSVFVVNCEFQPGFLFSLGPPLMLQYIFTASTCKATIISLQPCALNADFQHFIPRFNKISLLYGYPCKQAGLG